MTLAINIVHANAGYPARAHVNHSAGVGEAVDGGAPVQAWIQYGKSAVVHELQPGETVGDAEERTLQRMWAAYCDQAGGKTFDGKPLPTWQEIGQERQACWRSALRAI